MKCSKLDIWLPVEKNNRAFSGLIIGIDGTNLRQGGGITHLVELLRVAKPEKHGIAQVIVWANGSTLATLEDRPWLVKINPPALDQGLIKRILWQKFKLSQAARTAGCHLLFVPGGSYAGNFKPIVTMSQNMLPFERREFSRYGWSLKTLRLLLLRLSQSRSFQKANGVIFLTRYAYESVLKIIGAVQGQTSIIPHGLSSRFQITPKPQRAITEYTIENPYRLIYVSIIDEYKHQWHVVEAVAALRLAGLPVVLDLVGPAYPPALERLEAGINRFDPQRNWVNYCGAIPYEDLHLKYAQADLGIFASSCENMPNILLETMAAGLPVACSNRGPMPEVLGAAGVYFNPEKPLEIVRALRELIASPQLRAELARTSSERSRQFTWQHCTDDTFAFLAKIALQHKAPRCAAS
ncbi:MAG: glycosyltransferase family 1 protein [Methylococcaceae bacterium]